MSFLYVTDPYDKATHSYVGSAESSPALAAQRSGTYKPIISSVMIMGRSEFAVSINLFIARQIYLYTALQLQYVFGKECPKASYVVQKVDLDWVFEGIGLVRGPWEHKVCMTY